jgi:hypothetical protein
MEQQVYKSTGWSLAIGSLLAMVTMVLHPAGGSISAIIAVSGPLKVAHTLAICCLPFMLFGFYGCTKRLHAKSQLSILALFIICFGLFAAMMAALINGLALPFFLESYQNNIQENQPALSLIINYGFALNRALDYVFIAALCVGIFIYSLLILKTKKLNKMLGYLGVLIGLLAALGVVFEYSFVSLLEFQVFVFGIAVWMLCTGLALTRIKE